MPLTVLLKVNIGKMLFAVCIVYFSVGIPAIACVLFGVPNLLIAGNVLLMILINCSYQFVFTLSFHLTVLPDKFCPLLSNTVSVVLTLENFNNPLAA